MIILPHGLCNLLFLVTDLRDELQLCLVHLLLKETPVLAVLGDNAM